MMMMMMTKGKDIKENCVSYHFPRFSIVSFRPWPTIYPLNKGKRWLNFDKLMNNMQMMK